MTIIGITGPTGAGKTTALNELEKLGGVIIDCDAVYHELLKSNYTLQKELGARFGVLTDENGVFDRKKLGAVVFHDPAALADLNAIAHRHVVMAVKEILVQAEAQNIPAAAIDAIALFESGLAELCDATVAITAPAEIRVERIMARRGSLVSMPSPVSMPRILRSFTPAVASIPCAMTAKVLRSLARAQGNFLAAF